MNVVTSATTVKNVTKVNRPGVGPVYRAVIPIKTLYDLLRRSVVRYAPKYQRGFANKKLLEMTSGDYDRLLPINHEDLQIKLERAQEMAVKYLVGMGLDLGILDAADWNTRLFSSHIVWNARKDNGDEPEYDEEEMTLVIPTDLTVPDTAHRHLAYYLLGFWKQDPKTIPPTVYVNEVPVPAEKIRELVSALDLDDVDRHQVYCDIYSLTAEEEGWLYDEFNADAKPPKRAVALDLNRMKTPTRRFIYRLMDESKILSQNEVELRTNTIGAKSPKLTTNSTLDQAAQQFKDTLMKLEGTPQYDDLMASFVAFFDEWAKHYPVFQPKTSGDDRHAFREESFALANITFHALFQMAFDFWDECRKKAVDWRTDKSWKDALAKLAGGSVKVTDPHTGKPVTDASGKVRKVPFMHRDNPAWKGTILIKRFDQDGKITGYSLSNTRQTRKAAYHYMRKMAGLN